MHNGYLETGLSLFHSNLHANLRKVKAWIQSKDKSCQCDQHLGQRRVHIHEKPTPDVLGSEPAKVDLIESNSPKPSTEIY